MTVALRPYQLEAIDNIYIEWRGGNRFVALVMPTGSGKSVTLCEVARREVERGQYVLILAHRQELITQLSDTLARYELRHGIIAAKNTVRFANRLHMENYGRSFYEPATAKVFVGSVQSMRPADIARFVAYGDRLTVIQDEFHHATKQSKTWGNILTPLDDAGAYGLGPTATLLRADGKGLGRTNDGYADTIVLGPQMGDLIEAGFLSKYKIYCPKTDLDLTRVKVSKTTGDFQDKELKEEIHRSHIVGDIVDHYLKICPGKRGITFTVGIDTAEEVAEQFRGRGVPAMALSGRNSDEERVQSIRDLKSGKILMIVNDSLIGEGVDIPAVEVVLFARPTQSYGLYVQMFGRALRLMEGKTHAIIIDAVNNVLRHGLPDAPREWSLERRERRSSSSEVSTIRVCLTCTAVFERFRDACPECGEPIPAPALRTGPEQVDGDLYELDAATLATMRAAIARVDMAPDDYRNQLVAQGCPQLGVMGNVKRLVATQEVVAQLREAEAVWAGYERAAGLSDREIMRKFFSVFGVDLWTAQTWKATDMTVLIERINGSIRR